jgi:hypothetical protein
LAEKYNSMTVFVEKKSDKISLRLKDRGQSPNAAGGNGQPSTIYFSGLHT